MGNYVAQHGLQKHRALKDWTVVIVTTLTLLALLVWLSLYVIGVVLAGPGD